MDAGKKDETDSGIIGVDGNVSYMEPIDRPPQKANPLERGFKPAIVFDPITNEKTFVAAVGDTVLIEYTKTQWWRDDSWCRVLSIDGVTGDVSFIDTTHDYHVGSNFKKAWDHGVYMWLPPKGGKRSLLRIKCGRRKKKQGVAKEEQTQKRPRGRPRNDTKRIDDGKDPPH